MVRRGTSGPSWERDRVAGFGGHRTETRNTPLANPAPDVNNSSPRIGPCPVPPPATPILATARALGRCFCAAGLIVATGCTTPKRMADYRADTNQAASVARAEAGGLAIVIDPFLDAARSKEYFGIDAAAKGLLVIHVQLQNRSPDATYLVQRGAFRFLPADGKEVVQGAGSQTGAAESMAVGAAILASPALLAVAAQMVANAGNVEQNFLRKELPAKSLPPGKTLSGFLYFQAGSKPLRRGKGVLEARIPAVGGTSVTEIQIPVNYETH